MSLLEARLLELAADELADDAARHIRVDEQLGGQVVGPRRAALLAHCRLFCHARLLAQQPFELARHELRPLVAQQRQSRSLTADVVKLDVDDMQSLIEQWRFV